MEEGFHELTSKGWFIILRDNNEPITLVSLIYKIYGTEDSVGAHLLAATT
jgi:hypothetical protein